MIFFKQILINRKLFYKTLIYIYMAWYIELTLNTVGCNAVSSADLPSCSWHTSTAVCLCSSGHCGVAQSPRICPQALSPGGLFYQSSVASPSAPGHGTSPPGRAYDKKRDRQVYFAFINLFLCLCWFFLLLTVTIDLVTKFRPFRSISNPHRACH